MDRFVTRTPTWKTLNYTSVARQSLAENTILGKKTTMSSQSSKHSSRKKQPLQQKQLNDISSETLDLGKRLDLLNSNHTTANAENFNANSNDSGLSSASSISPQQSDDNVLLGSGINESPSKTMRSTLTKNCLDYIDCPADKENNTCMTITRTPKPQMNVVESGLYFEKALEVSKKLPSKTEETPDKLIVKSNNMIMARIQRDLNSPSAAARIKAIKALKSPTKSAYSHFDIPEAEQSLYFPEPPSLQEIMRNIVVYVEVRSGEDNRSAGVRKVIEALGARVNLSLLRDTTHVIFKDGLLSTYKKATQMNIPIVSILWIEACKNQHRICDPKDYPISNLDRYENPELYTKMKRVKSMQPDSECNKRIRAKPSGTPKDSTPTHKTGTLKKTSTLICGTPTNSTSKKKTDISQFFKKLEKSSPSSVIKIDDASGIAISESPATKLLNRINSECYTPLEQMKKALINNKNSNVDINNIESLKDSSKSKSSAKKALDFIETEVSNAINNESGAVVNLITNLENNVNTKLSSYMTIQQKLVAETDAPLLISSSRLEESKPQRRHSIMPASEVEAATNSMITMAISITPSKRTRRRSSVHTPKDMSLAVKTANKTNNTNPILEETTDIEKEELIVENSMKQDNPSRSVSKRRTLYAVQTINQTDLLKSETIKEIEKTSTKSYRRRTIYDSKTMETSEIETVNRAPDVTSTRRHTCCSVKPVEDTDIDEIANSPIRKSIINNKMTDLINEEDIKTPPPTTKGNNSSNQRRTLYGTQKINDNSISTISAIDSNVSEDLCVTPTNCPISNIISSTYHEESVNRNRLIATPPADATTGKLLEETSVCVTPLIFSSTRQPGNRRRTLFDVSMDIITQRLQCINQSARRSLAPPTPSAELATALEKITTIPADINKISISQSNKDKTTSQCLVDTLVGKDNGVEITSATTPEVKTSKKKRKLFMPNETLTTPAAVPIETSVPLSSSNKKTTTESDNLSSPVSSSSVSNSVSKRRRTLMPISQPQSTLIATPKNCNSTSVRNRRSTLDFEQVEKIKTKTKAINDSDNTSSSSSATTTELTSKHLSKAKKTPVLVYTNMHHQQIDVINEAVNKLGLFNLESCVTDATTHLVSLEPRRTLNLLRALARGLWILDYSWILLSLNAGRWLPEEQYELQNFSRAVEICRSERQAFGSNYKCELFRRIGLFYISSQCSPINKESMRELIVLCGGRVVNSRQKARYIIADTNCNLEGKFYLTPYWVLDSITQMQLMKVHKYMYRLQEDKPASQPI